MDRYQGCGMEIRLLLSSPGISRSDAMKQSVGSNKHFRWQMFSSSNGFANLVLHCVYIRINVQYELDINTCTSNSLIYPVTIKSSAELEKYIDIKIIAYIWFRWMELQKRRADSVISAKCTTNLEFALRHDAFTFSILSSATRQFRRLVLLLKLGKISYIVVFRRSMTFEANS